jgi:hypothetical protein
MDPLGVIESGISSKVENCKTTLIIYFCILYKTILYDRHSSNAHFWYTCHGPPLTWPPSCCTAWWWRWWKSPTHCGAHTHPDTYSQALEICMLLSEYTHHAQDFLPLYGMNKKITYQDEQSLIWLSFPNLAKLLGSSLYSHLGSFYSCGPFQQPAGWEYSSEHSPENNKNLNMIQAGLSRATPGDFLNNFLRISKWNKLGWATLNLRLRQLAWIPG